MVTTADLQLENERSLKGLQRLLHGEVAAAEAYELVMERLGISAPSVLGTCLQSHQQRVELLTVHIFELGAKPEDRSGAWGTFVKLLENGAALVSQCAAIGLLEEGEDHGLAEYRTQLDELSPESRRFVESELLPEQVRTHDFMRLLCSADTKAPSDECLK